MWPVSGCKDRDSHTNILSFKIVMKSKNKIYWNRKAKHNVVNKIFQIYYNKVFFSNFYFIVNSAFLFFCRWNILSVFCNSQLIQQRHFHHRPRQQRMAVSLNGWSGCVSVFSFDFHNNLLGASRSHSSIKHWLLKIKYC